MVGGLGLEGDTPKLEELIGRVKDNVDLILRIVKLLDRPLPTGTLDLIVAELSKKLGMDVYFLGEAPRDAPVLVLNPGYKGDRWAYDTIAWLNYRVAYPAVEVAFRFMETGPGKGKLKAVIEREVGDRWAAIEEIEMEIETH